MGGKAKRRFNVYTTYEASDQDELDKSDPVFNFFYFQRSDNENDYHDASLHQYIKGGRIISHGAVVGFTIIESLHFMGGCFRF